MDYSVAKSLSVHDAAVAYGLNETYLKRLIMKELVRTFGTGRYAEVSVDSLEHFLGKRQAPPLITLVSTRKPNYSVLEVCAGAGGLALGLENAGLRSVGLVEMDAHACDTLRYNRPLWNVIQAKIENIDFTPFKGTDVLAGGIPCQPFSYAGPGNGFLDTRGTVFFEFARAIREIEPKVVLIENVVGLSSHDHGKTLEVMCNVLEDLGYSVFKDILRSQFLDVPQKRERLLIVGVNKVGGEFLWPEFPHEHEYTYTLLDALYECPPSPGMQYSARKRHIMSMVPPGGNWRNLPLDWQKEYLGKAYYNQRGGMTNTARRLEWNEPCPTLLTSPSQKMTERCHPDEDRPLTVREYARIQTFPDAWQFCGPLASQYKQIGNAVPVNLGYHIGKFLAGLLDAYHANLTVVLEEVLNAKES